MPVGASDFDNNAGMRGVSVEWMALSTRNDGTFVSRPLDASDDRVTGLAVTPTADGPPARRRLRGPHRRHPAGLDAATGRRSAPARAAKRYVQYRATSLDRSDGDAVAMVEASFTVDDQVPVVTIDPVEVTGATAKVRFSSDDPSARCSARSTAQRSPPAPAPRRTPGSRTASTPSRCGRPTRGQCREATPSSPST